MRVSDICKYIREHLDQDLTLEALAQQFGYSKFHLSRQFKRETGYTFKQYVEALKIEQSIEAILDEDQKVTEAFLSSQHESSGTFSNTFKKLTGLSPNLYKKSVNRLVETLLNAIKNKGEIVYRRQTFEGGGSLTVSLHYPEIHDHRVSFAGLFETGIPNSAPIVGVALYQKQQCLMENIPPGQYYLMATEIDLTAEATDYFKLNENYRAKLNVPITIVENSHQHFELTMRLAVAEDPPIVVNLPNLVKLALVRSPGNDSNS